MDNTKTINAAQTKRLYAFTRQHFVEHYDLQTELVDHIAHGIEAQWQQHPELDFEKALQSEFKKFGIFGFQDVIEKRDRALSKKYYKLLWGYFRSYFGLPKILMCITAVVAIYLLLRISVWIYAGLLIMILVASIIRLIKIRRAYNKKIKETGKRWILEDIIFNAGGFGHMLYLPIQAVIHIKEPVSDMLLWILSALLVVLILFDYVILFVIPGKAQQHLEETYPEYRFEVSE